MLFMRLISYSINGFRWSGFITEDSELLFVVPTLLQNFVIIFSVNSRLFYILSHNVRFTIYCCKCVSVNSFINVDCYNLSIYELIVVRPVRRVLRSSSVRQFIGLWRSCRVLENY